MDRQEETEHNYSKDDHNIGYCYREKEITQNRVNVERNIRIINNMQEHISELRDEISLVKTQINDIENTLDSVADGVESLNNGGLEDRLMEQTDALIDAIINESDLDKKIEWEKWKIVGAIVGGSGVLYFIEYFISSLLGG